MSSAIISTTVRPFGPQLTVFPNEILLEIFKFLMFSMAANRTRIIDAKYFGFFLGGFGPFGKLLRTSRHFRHLASVAFYELNLFEFHNRQGVIGGVFDHCKVPALPRIVFRESLRRMKITLHLADHFRGLETAADGTSEYVSQRIVSVQQLFEHCPGARQLRDLTNALTGFSKLQELELLLIPTFDTYLPDEFQEVLAVYRAANFLVSARAVKVRVTNQDGIDLDWHPKLAQAIGI
ncbi:hypothetical protein EJ02DRAFT_24834 [Clathrospora elynae]|uniref:Uncharacterized protein n=1 Tax=Clathrospora elynae TaxID=706981 RepID=A0A6A5T1D9_9PLEO|nr:hypothetical protein EJ02DRAFT_24834 [Clathrospora elynae]